MSDKLFYAHSGTKVDRSDWQFLHEHLENTSTLAAEHGATLRLSATAALAGAYHDLGKYDPEFDKILCGANIRVDLSPAGAKFLTDRVLLQLSPIAEILAYTILGHHAGLPDKQDSESSLAERLRTILTAFRQPF